MKVLVDTSVWSLALRRSSGDRHLGEQRIVDHWRNLVREARAVIVGPVRQELLSGIRHERQFERLREILSSFPDFPVAQDDFVEAALFYNRCRKYGITGMPVDLLLCAVSSKAELPIFSTDKDFLVYSRYLPIRLYRTG